MASFPQLDLVYFGVRARAECARMIMEYGGIPYNDTDCNSFFGMSFGDAKQSGKLPFGQLPVMQIGGKGGRLIAQSGAINRYLAAQVKNPGFVPTDLAEQAYCDMIHEAAEELFMIMPCVNIFKGEKFQQEKENYFKNTLPTRLQNLAKLLSTNQFFCGSTVTYCDFDVYVFFDLCRLVEPTVFKDFPNIEQWMSRVENLPGVKDYLARRPEPVEIGVNPHMEPRA
jgi:glutathione S-transferase